ncbi:MAG: type II secretion system minor pseudopilin GspH [Gammaproteobacteria bacterium]
MAARPRQAGFSLLELLVVVVIVGLMAGMAVFSIGAVGRETPAETEARRLTALLQLVSEEALVQGRDFGLEIFSDGYRFLSWDPDSRLWVVPAGDELLRARSFPEDLQVGLVVEGREIALSEQGGRREERRDQVAPHVAISAGGEFTPFELYVAEAFEPRAWLLTGAANGTLDLIEPGEEP